jgi:ATP-binding cassette subfamily G (WHITE) protein 2 (PDR)
MECRIWSNGLSSGFESILINEFHNRNFTCSQFIPSMGPYDNVTGLARVCATVGATAGSNYVNGDTYLFEAYGYKHSHKWRNVGFIIAFMLFLMAVYLLATGTCYGYSEYAG